MSGASVAFVTGAGSGLGQLTTWHLAAAGWRVAAVDVDPAGLERTARRTANVVPFTVDVTDAGAVAAAVEKAEVDLGPLDRVVSAAAIAPTAPILEQDLDEIRRLTEVNYLGSVHVLKATVPGLLERGRGEVVQYASLAGWLPTPQFGAYAATKHAVVAFTDVLAHECAGRGVRFAIVCPPVVDTPLLDQVRDHGGAFAATRPIRPEVVIGAVEEALERGELFVFPGRGTRAVWRARRWMPEAVWRRVQRLEARR